MIDEINYGNAKCNGLRDCTNCNLLFNSVETDKEIFYTVEHYCPQDCENCCLMLSLICTEYVKRGLRTAMTFDKNGKCIEKYDLKYFD